jgi:apolipoprotein D and lipocalin family protein
MSKAYGSTAVLGLSLALYGCSGMAPLQTVEGVDLERFMGDWYVIANIPTPLEKGAHNAVESYRLDSNGTVATTFTFLDGGFDGKRKTYHPRGFISDESNAVWGMQFVWPIKADYRIVYLDDAYSTTVIGRNKRDYVWIMARKPTIPDARFGQILEFLESVGYDVAAIERVPQRW